MSINATSLAAGVGSSVKNVQFVSEALNVPRKVLIIGTYDPAKTGIANEVPVRVLSDTEVGATYGFGSMLHRLAIAAYKGSNGVETWIQPQAEAGGAVAAAGSFDFAGSTGIKAGTVYLYIAGDAVPFTITDSDTANSTAIKAAAAINAIKNLPVTAAVDGVTLSKVNVTAKSKGPFGNGISIAFNLAAGEALPTGVTVAVIAMASGAGVPTIANALNALGTGDSANENYFTDVVHGYMQDSTSLTAISAYVGEGNGFTGLYTKTVARPFRVLTGDVAAGTAGLNAMIAITDTRKQDRANGILAVPDSPSHPSEIAAQAMGIMARINNDRAAEHYNGQLLSGVWPGDKGADRWTSDYDNRDIAIKASISPTRVISGAVYLQNVVTFYRPDNVPVSSNGYRSMRNISILQNILFNIGLNFSQEKWQGISIVSDVVKVGNVNDRKKARDIDSVKDDLVNLAKSFEDHAWIYSSDFTIGKLKEAGAVVIRTGTTGFDSTLSVILSGEGGILDTVTEFDTSIAVLTA